MVDGRLKLDKKGIAIYLVLGVLLIVVFLGGMFMTFVVSQSRFSHHQLSRIQALYAAKAGMYYAIDRLSQQDPNWSAATPFERFICRESGAAHCSDATTLIDPLLPHTIKLVKIAVGAANSGIQNTRTINITVDYTYSDKQ
ncbi:MAG TPA: hypothetical protein PLF03_03300 [Candidatus Omnitrophota bacterium]|nr:hypothetical protein [Candidatus Omnitrophota bacterium]